VAGEQTDITRADSTNTTKNIGFSVVIVIVAAKNKTKV
jgi:hypothetical protein